MSWSERSVQRLRAELDRWERHSDNQRELSRSDVASPAAHAHGLLDRLQGLTHVLSEIMLAQWCIHALCCCADTLLKDRRNLDPNVEKTLVQAINASKYLEVCLSACWCWRFASLHASRCFGASADQAVVPRARTAASA